ncbi:NuoM family protein [Sulfurimonas sp.]|uniref:complex I subunit 4 family protein n=1 Tax=Sulfurimonas sp. TaxID=2022749 RepID=UPI0035626E65
MENILSYIIFTPVVTAIILGSIRANITILKAGAAISSLLVFFFSLLLTLNFNPDMMMQFSITSEWISSAGFSYHIGVDALSLVLLLLVSFLMPLLYIYMQNESRKGYWYNMMLLQTGVSGAILSLDLILFYLFWETMLLPIFIMIGKYGSGMKQFNAMKILLMTILGSMSMLFSIIYIGYIYFHTYGVWSFNLDDLATLSLSAKATSWLAVGFLLAFAIKIPLLGFHTWMAPAYGSSPTPAVVILSAIMAKLGVYGIWRFGYSLFEEVLVFYMPYIIFIAILGMIYYAVRAVTEDDLRKMFAFASGSHLSLIALGMILANSYAWAGSLYFIATHALASAGIFLMIGLTYKRFKTIKISELGGVARKLPKFTFFFSFFALSIAGLPGTGGFVAELLIILGAFKSAGLIVGLFTATTVIMAILYVFWMLQRTIFGQVSECVKNTEAQDLNLKEILMLSPIVIMLLLTGIAPSLFTPFIEPYIINSLESITPLFSGVR